MDFEVDTEAVGDLTSRSGMAGGREGVGNGGRALENLLRPPGVGGKGRAELSMM